MAGGLKETSKIKLKLLTHSVKKHLLRTYYVLGTI